MGSKGTVDRNWIRLYDVTEPRRHRKGFTVYKVTSKVFPKLDPSGLTVLTVWKRYNDFKNLYVELQQIHRQLYLSGNFPEFPKAQFFRRFDEDVIEERRVAALSLLQFAGLHVQLFASKVFIKFFEEGYELSDISETSNEIANGENNNGINDEDPNACLTPEKVWYLDNSVRTEVGDDSGSADSDSLASEKIPPVQSSPVTPSPPLAPDAAAAAAHTGANVDISEAIGIVTLLPPTSSPSLLAPSPGSSVVIPEVVPGTSGFIDFLPKFPVRQDSSEGNFELSSSYVCEAAAHFSVAQGHESVNKLEEAFESYKEGIRILLVGAKGSGDTSRKALVNKQLKKYLAIAERIHEQLLSPTHSPSLPPNLAKTVQNRTDRKILFSPQEDLKRFRIVGVIEQKIYIVVNVEERSGPRCYAMKVLPFSSEPIDPDQEVLLPMDVPFMVKLLKVFRTDSSYILLLHYASGGKLMDYIDHYQTKVIERVRIETETDESPSSTPPSESSLSPAQETENFEPASAEGDIRDSQEQGKSGLMRRQPLLPRFQNYSDSSLISSAAETEEGERVIKELMTSEVKLNEEAWKNSDPISIVESSKKLLEIVSSRLGESREMLPSALESEKSAIEFVSPPEATPTYFESNTPASSLSPKLPRTLKFLAQSPLVSESHTEAQDSPEKSIKRTIPVGCIKGWAAEIVICLENYHAKGLVYGDLSLDNILLGENGHILVCFKGKWPEVDSSLHPMLNEHSAPEVVYAPGNPSFSFHPSADFWSLGAILFQLFTGKTVHEVHPEGFHPQTVIRIPSENILGEPITPDVRSLLTELLEINPTHRLGYYGAEEIKSHPSFHGFDWDFIPEGS